MIQNLMNISGALDKAQGAIQSFIANYSIAMNAPLKRMAKAVLQEQNHLDGFNIKIMEENLINIESTLNELVSDIKISKPPTGLFFFNLRHLIDEIVNELIEEQGPFHSSLTVSFEDPTMLFSDRKTLGKLIKDILENILYANGADPEIIRLESEMHKGQCIINVFRSQKLYTIGNSSMHSTQQIEPTANTHHRIKIMGDHAHLEVAQREGMLYSIAIPGNF